MLTEDLRHRHSWLAGDGEKIKYSDLDFGTQWNLNFFAFDLWGQSWANADGTFRDVVYPWINGDLLADYTKTVLSGLWTSTVKYTQRSYFDPLIFDGTDITIKPWKIVTITAAINAATAILRLLLTGWTFRYLEGSTTDLTQANPRVSFVSASSVDIKMRLRYVDTGLNKPIFGANIQIR